MIKTKKIHTRYNIHCAITNHAYYAVTSKYINGQASPISYGKLSDKYLYVSDRSINSVDSKCHPPLSFTINFSPSGCTPQVN